ncbi:MAG: family 1 glycosylhydrolase [Firmicutes bacterium]|jgi:beta-glucosidase/6-phospho-beta-glucosidase/beta-galactosidase|nr:family 1 glycosylhydrolase [Bacillota bacterium]MDH7494696.1 family 1 glycosylhydrolase [Bacillota bacterium]
MVESTAHFFWATGIEDTFVAQVEPGRRRLDLYELQHHYDMWKEDLDLVGELGVKVMRYGVPWYLVNPSPGLYDWSFTDRVLEYMTREKGVSPIVDLVHYGCPLWLQGEFVNPDYPKRVADYAAAFAERYKPLGVRCFTPLNEPYVNAEYCGLIGRWPPRLSGEEGFVRLCERLGRGIIATVEALKAVTPEAVMVHVEATGLALSEDPSLRQALEPLNERRFVVLELIQGRVGPDHVLRDWLVDKGLDDDDLAWFSEHALRLDVLGLNYYPELSVRRFFERGGRLESEPWWGGAECLKRLIREHWRRYRRPVFLTETSTNEKAGDRVAWLRESVSAVRELRQEGIPVIGYTWWPLYDLVNWDYREGAGPAEDYIEPMGLWSLEPRDGGRLLRKPTRAVAVYQELISSSPVGEIGEDPCSPKKMTSGRTQYK